MVVFIASTSSVLLKADINTVTILGQKLWHSTYKKWNCLNIPLHRTSDRMEKSQSPKAQKKADRAHEVRELLETDYPNARKIILVCDNLNTHIIGAFYSAFASEQASKIVKRLEIHHTPKQGSWLNIAEIELSALSRQRLDRRVDKLTLLVHETKKWKSSRNLNQKPVNWKFTSEKCKDKTKTIILTILSVPIH
jgi:hypothetical protein